MEALLLSPYSLILSLQELTLCWEQKCNDIVTFFDSVDEKNAMLWKIM